MNRRGLRFVLSSFLLCYALQLARCETDAYHCVWRGNCGFTELGVSRTCASNDPPESIDPQSNSNLREKCPHYFEGKGILSRIDLSSLRSSWFFHFCVNVSDSPELCCDADNVKTLIENLNMAESIFGRCPTCLKNVYKLLCDLVCSPEQSKFLRVTKTGNNYTTESGKRKEYVEEIEVRDILISLCLRFFQNWITLSSIPFFFFFFKGLRRRGIHEQNLRFLQIRGHASEWEISYGSGLRNLRR